MTQIQLSQAQTVLLSTACARDDGAIFPVTANLKGGAVGNVCKSLLKQGLIEEVAATDLDTVWRHDAERGPITLQATPLAYITLGIRDGQTDTSLSEALAPPTQRRKGTKQETLIEMLQAEGGATIEEIVAATGWQPHSARGAMSGALKKRLGLIITSEKIEGRGRVYSLRSDHTVG
ncbi:DUF3489 domain-containing protein [Ruegeria sp. 1NDH52C]|uniref:DUF3489 domain-containing protein n=1 Tax=Ruegeria alba TaxID=2916756 RepID=A0ABS9P348_9RHOB|nr:DUF3489 domain-containing protein [Ruegeria alba]MCG6560854.1 DUF3489 domain-containing protein [Ruegeria alba]